MEIENEDHWRRRNKSVMDLPTTKMMKRLADGEEPKIRISK